MKNFDELLDGVLREDAAAEPRAGLEGRVMVRVRADRALPRGCFSQDWNRWRRWLPVPAAACLVAAVSVWYVSDGRVPHPDAAALRGSSPVLAIPAVEAPKPMAADAQSNAPQVRERPLFAEAVARQPKRVRTASAESEPKLETFPAVSQQGNPAGWLGRDENGKFAAIANEVTPAAAKAYRQLQEAQSEPIGIAAIEITPLQ